MARAGVEIARIVPVIVTAAIGVGVLLALEFLYTRTDLVVAGLVGGLVLLAAGVVAAVITTAAKWTLVGRLRAVEHPLWSSFVWRNELADTFVETMAAPWFARAAAGTPLLNLWLRSLGRPDRARRVVRDVLAARGRPGPARRAARRQIEGASCRRTSSTIGSCEWTRWCWATERRSGRTA